MEMTLKPNANFLDIPCCKKTDLSDRDVALAVHKKSPSGYVPHHKLCS
jgi:hypothetical protein